MEIFIWKSNIFRHCSRTCSICTNKIKLANDITIFPKCLLDITTLSRKCSNTQIIVAFNGKESLLDCADFFMLNSFLVPIKSVKNCRRDSLPKWACKMLLQSQEDFCKIRNNRRQCCASCFYKLNKHMFANLYRRGVITQEKIVRT